MTTQDNLLGAPQWVIDLVIAAGLKYNIPPELLLAQLKQESGFNPNAISPAGAKGIAQFIPSTAQAYGLQVNSMVDERLNPSKAIDAQARYMQDLYKSYGNWNQALSAYNSGKKDAYLDPNFSRGETYNYVRNVTGMWNQVAGQLSSGDVSSSYQDKTNIPNEFSSIQRSINDTVKPAQVLAAETRNQPVSATRTMPTRTQSTIQPGSTYTVQKGDTLWDIAQRSLGSGTKWQQLKGYTGDPRKMPIGTKISIPKSTVSSTVTKPQTVAKAVSPIKSAQRILTPTKTAGASATMKTTVAQPKKTTTSKPKTNAVQKAVKSALNIINSWKNSLNKMSSKSTYPWRM